MQPSISFPFPQNIEPHPTDLKKSVQGFPFDLESFLSCAASSMPSLPTTPPSGIEQRIFTMPKLSCDPKPAARPPAQPMDGFKPEPAAAGKSAAKMPAKKPGASKVASAPSPSSLHPLLYALNLASLFSGDSVVEDALMQHSVETLRSGMSLISRLIKRKNYHSKKGNVLEATAAFTPTRPVAEPSLPMDLTLRQIKKVKKSNADPGATPAGLPTPVLSTSNTSPSSSQTFPFGLCNPLEPISVDEDGKIWLSLKLKGSPTTHRIRVDIDFSQSDDQFSVAFKAANCLFPPTAELSEREVVSNLLGLRLAYLNPDVLAGNRPLLLAAVDAFQLYFPGMCTPNFGDAAMAFNADHGPDFANQAANSQIPFLGDLPGLDGMVGIPPLVIKVHSKGISDTLLLSADLDTVDLEALSEEFKKENCVFPRAYHPLKGDQGGPLPEARRLQLEAESFCNALAWKLAYLNPVTLAGNLPYLQCALDTYRNLYTHLPTRPCRPVMALPSSVHSADPVDLSVLMQDPQFAKLLPQ